MKGTLARVGIGVGRIKKRIHHAGENHDEASAPRCAPRQGSVHAGGRVCARGDASYPPGKTRRSQCETSDRDWALEGASIWSKAGSAPQGKGICSDPAQSETRYRARSQRCAAGSGTHALTVSTEGASPGTAASGVTSLAL